ncbi:hypothetical protein [Butyrivibrio fibrisolvens]|uniref:hypothetical protein n=1 Tax=Butyrivibrio fibrisolvens TaxID=831 RepID=UPI0003B6E80D|nr:hypothetical protein [Butyrivibrio fibrisolvens]
MKKKIVAVVAMVVATMTLVMGTTSVLAASRTDTAEVLGATRSREDAGEAAVLGIDRKQNSIEVSFEPITDAKVLADIEDKTILADTINLVNEADAKATGSTEEVKKLTKDDIEVLTAFDVVIADGTVIDAENPVYITFTVPGITADTKIHVMHYAAGGVWEEVASETGSGFVVGEFTSLSPVAIVAEKSSLSAAANTSNKGTGSKTSPRTGDNQILFVVIFAVIAVACVSGTFISLRKEKKK